MKNLICRLIIAILGVFQICWTGSFSKNLMASSMIEIVPSFENAPLVRDYWWKGYPESQGNAACPSRDDLLGPLESIISTFKSRKQLASFYISGWGNLIDAIPEFDSNGKPCRYKNVLELEKLWAEGLNKLSAESFPKFLMAFETFQYFDSLVFNEKEMRRDIEMLLLKLEDLDVSYYRYWQAPYICHRVVPFTRSKCLNNWKKIASDLDLFTPEFWMDSGDWSYHKDLPLKIIDSFNPYIQSDHQNSFWFENINEKLTEELSKLDDEEFNSRFSREQPIMFGEYLFHINQRVLAHLNELLDLTQKIVSSHNRSRIDSSKTGIRMASKSGGEAADIWAGISQLVKNPSSKIGREPSVHMLNRSHWQEDPGDAHLFVKKEGQKKPKKYCRLQADASGEIKVPVDVDSGVWAQGNFWRIKVNDGEGVSCVKGAKSVNLSPGVYYLKRQSFLNMNY